MFLDENYGKNILPTVSDEKIMRAYKSCLEVVKNNNVHGREKYVSRKMQKIAKNLYKHEKKIPYEYREACEKSFVVGCWIAITMEVPSLSEALYRNADKLYKQKTGHSVRHSAEIAKSKGKKSTYEKKCGKEQSIIIKP